MSLDHLTRFRFEVSNHGVECASRTDCENCGSPGEIVHQDLIDREFGAPGVWSTRRCSNRRCGLAWLEPQPRVDQIGRFYENYWTHTDDGPDGTTSGGSGGRTRLKRMLANVIFWRRTALLSADRYLAGEKPGRLLDVGCGSGRYLEGMARKGWEAHGIDFDEQAVEVARRRPGVDVGVGDLISQNYPDAYFDAVVMSNVIEHIPNPTEVFAECHRITAHGGRLVMMTPNIESLGHQAFGPDWRGLEPPRHLFLFTGRALRQFARRAGFSKMEVFSSPGGSSALAYVLSQSAQSARAAGRQPVKVDQRQLSLKARVLDVLGLLRGEWVVLVATR